MFASFRKSVTKAAPPAGAILHLEPNDIVCSRNSLVHKNPGNKRYTALIQAHQESYEQATSRSERMAIRRNIVQAVKAYGGRFVKFCADTETWVELSDKDVRDKVAHALRGSNKMTKAKSAKSLRRQDSNESFEAPAPLDRVKSMPNVVVPPAAISSFTSMPMPEPPQRAVTSPEIALTKPIEEFHGYGYEPQYQPTEEEQQEDQRKRRMSAFRFSLRTSFSLRQSLKAARRSIARRMPSFRASTLLRQSIVELPVDDIVVDATMPLDSVDMPLDARSSHFDVDANNNNSLNYGGEEDEEISPDDLAAIHNVVGLFGGQSQ